MRKIILALVLLCLIPLSFAQEYSFLVSFSYDFNADSFSFDSVKIIEAEAPEYEEPEEGYLLKVFSETESFEMKFEPANVLFVDPPVPAEEMFDENGEQIYFPTLEETIQIEEYTSHVMLLPYIENAKMQVMDLEGNKKLEVDLQEEIDKQFPELEEEPEPEEVAPLPIDEQTAAIIAILAIVIVVAYYLLRKKKKK